MKTSLFDYELPKEIIAQNPPEKRGDTKLLVLNRKTRSIQHKHYSDIPDYIKKDDVVVLNKTKVLWARIFPTVKRTGRRVEVLFLKNAEKGLWHCLVGRARNVKIGDRLLLNEYELEIVERKESDPGFMIQARNAKEIMSKYGHVPLPPYIKRKDVDSDKIRYNTVFAEDDNSVAAPTASLNLIEKSLKGIKDRGAKVCYVDLEVGWGTFAPINTEKVEDFQIHPEEISIGKSAVDCVNKCKGRVWAFGTTVVRALESVAIDSDKIKRYEGETSLFIYPGYKFKVVDVLVTNFHAPRTSLLTLVSAFAGRGLIMRAYEEAKKEKCRFLSYGDSMLIT